MSPETFSLSIVILLTFGFALASILGYVFHRIKLSPIIGYLLAGYLIGPFSPGYAADTEMAEQLAEIGVILMMFGVGLHFKWQDLMDVKKIAIPGAIAQVAITSLVVTVIVHAIGWKVESGIIFGLGIGVASTVVLVRLLTENHLLKTTQGHIAVGWLIVEDLITVLMLLLVPILASSSRGEGFLWKELSVAFGLSLLKFLFLIVIIFTVGRKVIKFFLMKVVSTSHELFVLTILAITFSIAAISAIGFHISIALGAFLAGMVMGQTDVRHKVTANTLPLKDVFVVIFFLSVGMLFNPFAIVHDFILFIIILGVILLIKPLIAFAIMIAFKYPIKISFTIAIALAQIGEFTFILAEQASRHKILPDQGYDIIVACSLVSIIINPLIFNFLKTEGS